MKIQLPFQVNYKNGFVVLVVIIGLLMPFLSVDYGQTEDQRFHQEHGSRLLDYFKGVSDIAQYSPLNDQGDFVNVTQGVENEHRGMNIFGGFFDLLTNFLHQFFPSSGVYEFRNIINSLFGFLLFLFCGLIGKELGGWRAGVIVFVFVVLSPVFFGQAMTNPKDIPFTAFYMFSIFHIVKLLKELPRVTVKRAIFLIINFSLLINVRLLGLVIFGLFFSAIFAWWLIKIKEDGYKNIKQKETFLLGAKVLLIAVFGYLSTAIFWPYIQTKPITGVVELFVKLKDFKGFVSTQLFEGKWGNSHNVPWYYMIKSLLYITIPLHILLGYFLIPSYFYKKNKKQILLFSFILFSCLMPLVLLVIGKPNSYDNGRHFMFIVTPLIVVVGLAYNELITRITNPKYRKLAYFGILLLLLEPLIFTFKNHQLQSLYFSPVIGGTQGAFNTYEIDYWGVGVKPAIDWLEDNVGSIESPARVRLFYGEQLKLRYYTDKIPNLVYVTAPPVSPNWDYSIVMLSESKHHREILNVWPPPNSVYEVKVDGLTVCAVVKNDYQINSIEALELRLLKNPNLNEYIQLSLLYFNKGNHIKSIEASKKAIRLDSLNVIAYNNLGASYNTLSMYEEAFAACNKALKISPDFNLAINNLNVSKQGIERRKNNKLSEKEYLALSYNYFKAKMYNRSIDISKEILVLNPNNQDAYNNICSSFNILGEWEKAIEACNKAIEISPDFQLAKNNLNLAKSKINQ